MARKMGGGDERNFWKQKTHISLFGGKKKKASSHSLYFANPEGRTERHLTCISSFLNRDFCLNVSRKENL